MVEWLEWGGTSLSLWERGGREPLPTQAWLLPGGRRLTRLWVKAGYPAAAGRDEPTPNPPRGRPPQTPARADHRRTDARVTRAARRDRSPPAAAPDSCGPDGAPLPGPEVGEGGREEDKADGAEEVSRQAHRKPTPGIPWSALRGTKAPRRLRLPQPRKARALPIDGKATLRQA